MAAAFVAAAIWKLANADAWDEEDDAHIVDELLADEREVQVKAIDLSNHTWKEFVSVLCRPYHPWLRILLRTWTHRRPFSSRRRLTTT